MWLIKLPSPLQINVWSLQRDCYYQSFNICLNYYERENYSTILLISYFFIYIFYFLNIVSYCLYFTSYLVQLLQLQQYFSSNSILNSFSSSFSSLLTEPFLELYYFSLRQLSMMVVISAATSIVTFLIDSLFPSPIMTSFICLTDNIRRIYKNQEQQYMISFVLASSF